MCSPPMSRYAKKRRPNSSAPPLANSSFNLCHIPFAGAMTVLDSTPSSKPPPIDSSRSNSFVKYLSVLPAVTCSSDSRLNYIRTTYIFLFCCMTEFTFTLLPMLLR